jgi:predicted acylesterase/phospholipase RssA
MLADSAHSPGTGKLAFVLGGGGQLGAHEVGMLRALLERGVAPELVVGTSVGAINGAVVASDPTPERVAHLGGAFEIARRHRFVGDLAALPDEVTVHVMPTGQPDPPRYSDISQFRYRDTSAIADRISRAYTASLAYLETHVTGEL